MASEIMFPPLHRHTGAPLHNESFIAVERGPICMSSATSEMSMRECGSLGKLPVDVV